MADALRQRGAAPLGPTPAGGRGASTRRRLGAGAEEHAKNAPARRVLTPGTTLLREWHGVNHQETVLEGGVEYREQHYHSLSEVARKITGFRWSGPLFFGLRPRGQSTLSNWRKVFIAGWTRAGRAASPGPAHISPSPFFFFFHITYYV